MGSATDRDRSHGFTAIGIQTRATSVLHDDLTGLTLLVRRCGKGNDREYWRGSAPLLVVFSFEDEGGWVTHLPVIRTPRFRHVQRLRRLVHHYAAHISPRHYRRPENAFTPESLGALESILESLSVTAEHTAVEGFMAALAVRLSSDRPPLRLLPGGLPGPV